MLNIDAQKLAARLQQAFPGMKRELAVKRAGELIACTDRRLEQNVREWINGEPFTDVWAGKYCINAILAIREDRDFLSALDAMNLYLRDPEAGELRIWRARR